MQARPQTTRTGGSDGSPNAALEIPVAAIRAIRANIERAERPASIRESIAIDRHFASLMNLLAPRIRHLTRRYGLGDMVEDAWQASAIALHRAIDSYDTEQASFTTHATWQLRGELQSLRHRVRLDQRQSARRAGMRTISLDAADPHGEHPEWQIVDEAAMGRTEASARDWMTIRTFERLWQDYTAKIGYAARPHPFEKKVTEERALLDATIFDAPEPACEMLETAEQRRQARRRVTRHLQKLVVNDRY